MATSEEKAERLAAALRANLRRRKAQARGDVPARADPVSAGDEDAADADGGASGPIGDR